MMLENYNSFLGRIKKSVQNNGKEDEELQLEKKYE